MRGLRKVFFRLLMISIMSLIFLAIYQITFNKCPTINNEQNGGLTSLYKGVNRKNKNIENVRENKCIPFRSIYYLKIQRTGSTTMFNMLHRHALTNHMLAAVYKDRPHFGKDTFIKGLIPSFLEGHSTKLNLIADHSTYDRPNIETVLKKPIVYLTLMRHPQRQLASHIEYSPMVEIMNLTRGNSTGRYLNLLDEFEGEEGTLTPEKLRRFTQFLNWQANLFGFNNQRKRKIGSSEFLEHFKDIRENFIVGITDYFDESMVLFRRRLCLEFSDILYIILRKAMSMRPIDVSVSWALCSRSNLDCFLYDHFNRTLWREIEAEGPSFHDEASHYKRIVRNVHLYCSDVYRQMTKGLSHIAETLKSYEKYIFEERSKWNEPFNVTAFDCALMRIDERQFSNFFYFLQNKEACDDVGASIVKSCPVPWMNISCTEYCKSGKDIKSRLMTLFSEAKNFLWQ